MRPSTPLRPQCFRSPMTLPPASLGASRIWSRFCAILLVLVLLPLAGCGPSVRPDSSHLQRVRQEVLKAQQEGLSDAAPVEMSQCQHALQAAELAAENGDYGQVESLLKRIEVDLQTARLRARVNRLNQQLEAAKKRNAEAEQQLSEMQEALHGQ